MTRDFTVTTLVAAAMGLTVLHGQEPRGPNLERAFIGCIERVDKNTSDLLLTHAAPEVPSGQVGAGGTLKSDSLYRLVPLGNLKLAKLVGHKVRVVGILEREPPRTGRPTPPVVPVDERAAGTAQRLDVNAPTFRVRAVNSLAGKCPRQ